MSERRTAGNTNRLCARFGCNAPATATFTFDAATRTVWLDTPLDGNARVGELCTRHAASLTPPRGWQLDDRRPGRARRVDGSSRGAANGSSRGRQMYAGEMYAGDMYAGDMSGGQSSGPEVADAVPSGRAVRRRRSSPPVPRPSSSSTSSVVCWTLTVHSWRGLFVVPVLFDPV